MYTLDINKKVSGSEDLYSPRGETLELTATVSILVHSTKIDWSPVGRFMSDSFKVDVTVDIERDSSSYHYEKTTDIHLLNEDHIVKVLESMASDMDRSIAPRSLRPLIHTAEFNTIYRAAEKALEKLDMDS